LCADGDVRACYSSVMMDGSAGGCSRRSTTIIIYIRTYQQMRGGHRKEVRPLPEVGGGGLEAPLKGQIRRPPLQCIPQRDVRAALLHQEPHHGEQQLRLVRLGLDARRRAREMERREEGPLRRGGVGVEPLLQDQVAQGLQVAAARGDVEELHHSTPVLPLFPQRQRTGAARVRPQLIHEADHSVYAIALLDGVVEQRVRHAAFPRARLLQHHGLQPPPPVLVEEQPEHVQVAEDCSQADELVAVHLDQRVPVRPMPLD
jgi:hypothetical protein